MLLQTLKCDNKIKCTLILLMSASKKKSGLLNLNLDFTGLCVTTNTKIFDTRNGTYNKGHTECYIYQRARVGVAHNEMLDA